MQTRSSLRGLEQFKMAGCNHQEKGSLVALQALVACSLLACTPTVRAHDDPDPCTLHEQLVPVVPSGTPMTEFGVKRPPAYPDYSWGQFSGPVLGDQLYDHENWPTCWGLLGYGYLPGEIAHNPVGFFPVDPLSPQSVVTLPIGFSGNFDPFQSPSIGDFLPPGKTVADTALPLVPSGAGAKGAGWQSQSRPVLGGVADLVTGLPLIQATDLELPVGSATFRLVRTRSQPLDAIDRIRSGEACRNPTSDQRAVVGRWWDWLGTGWMVSENPILLIDSTLPDVVGPNPATCYLALDAHHSIPFQMVHLTDDGNVHRVGYEAPPRFRARLEHNGTWGDNQWAVQPTKYTVWLYDGAVKYTFVVIKDDLPPYVWNAAHDHLGGGDPPDWRRTSYHASPIYGGSGWDPRQYYLNEQPGYGLPYYAICVRMEDSFGNAANIHYCTVSRQPVDYANTPGCVECQDVCLRKGQIHHITLTTGGSGSEVIQWTLLYVHRRFSGYSLSWPPAELSPESPSIRGMTAIDRIYVFAGDMLAGYPSLFNTCLSIPATDMPYGPQAIDPAIENGIPDTWQHQIRYFYRPSAYPVTESTTMDGTPLVAMTDVATRAVDGPTSSGIAGTERHRHSFFRYTDTASAYLSKSQAFITQVYAPADYDWMQAWAASHAGDAAEAPRAVARYIRDATPLDFAFRDVPGNGSPLSASAASLLSSMATINCEPSLFASWPRQTGDAEFPPADSLRTGIHDYLRDVPADRLFHLAIPHAVRNLSVRGSGGVMHHFKLFHFVSVPDGVGSSPADGGPFHLFGFFSQDVPAIRDSRPNRSVFYSPYRWYSTVRNSSAAWPADGQVGTEPGDLSQIRWLRIIDEFDSAETRDSSAYSSDDAARKPGQLSRRVVGLNAAGFVLVDRTWTYRGDEVIASGGGLGETFIYRTAEAYFASRGTPLPAPLSNGADPAAALRNEALLLEKRSVGWSAVPSTEQASVGLVQQFEYDFANPPGLTPEQLPWSNRVRLMAEYVKSGTSDSLRRATRWLYYESAGAPTDISAEVVPLTEAAAAQRPNVVPDYATGQSSARDYAVTRWLVQRHAPPGAPEMPYCFWPVVQSVKVDPPRQVRPNSEWYFPVALQVTDPLTGMSPWSATGLVRNPISPSSGSPDEFESLILTYNEFDSMGRPEAIVLDAVPGSSASSPHGASFGVSVPLSNPVGWSRIGSTPALQWVTRTEYDVYGPSDVYLPNGRRWARRTITLYPTPEGEDPAGFREEPDDPADENATPSYTWAPRSGDAIKVRRDFVFADLETSAQGGQSTLVPRMPGQVLDFASEASAPRVYRPVNAGSVTSQWLNSTENALWNAPSGENSSWYAQYARLDMKETCEGPPLTPIRTRSVYFVDPANGSAADVSAFLNGPQQSTQPYFRRMVEAKCQPDEYGRLVEASLFERGFDGTMMPVGFTRVNELGEVYREQSMDGTITRLIRNSLGQALRRYVGTRDDAWSQATGEGTSLPFYSGIPSTNNLVLVERTEYGTDFTSAWLPTVSRRYTSNADMPAAWHLRPYGTPPAIDEVGQATETRYDWRMRPARTDVYRRDPKTSERISTTLTFLDHAGRTRLVVTFGRGTLPSLANGLDPSKRLPWQLPEVPSAEEFIQAGAARPTSISETIYGPDSTVNEQRNYDVAYSGSGTPPYQVEYSFTGLGGTEIYRQSEGRTAIVSELDSQGRLVSSATVMPSSTGAMERELTRTDYWYDADSNPFRCTNWERIDFADTANALVGTNAVASTSLTWFDAEHRVVATAELGTGHSSFISTGSPGLPSWYSSTQRPSIDPSAVANPVLRAGVPAEVPLTVNHYDRKGRLAYVARQLDVANGTATYSFTRNSYTGSGQLASTTENCFAPPASQRTTQYVYRFGKLADIRAVNSGATPTTQVTKTLFGAGSDTQYGAEIVDLGLPATTPRLASRHGSRVRSMHLPASSGAAASDAAVTLRYDFQGRIAERIDARGVVMRYAHDEFDRLVSITVGRYDSEEEFTPRMPESTCLPNMDSPVDRIGYIQLEYSEDNRSVSAQAFDGPDGNLISHVRLEHDLRGNLISDIQSLGDLISSDSPRVTYTWDWQPQTASAHQAGYSRLTTMTYPTPPGTPAPAPRVVTLGYGSPNSLEFADSIIASLTSTPGGPATPTQIATYSHTGTGRRSHVELAAGAFVASFGLDASAAGDGVIGLTGLDGFGRTKDLLYSQGSPQGTQPLLNQFQYTYDAAGNRLSAVRTPRPTGVNPATRQEQTNTYDAFDRLVSSSHTNFATPTGTGSVLQADTWTFDLLGNWTQRHVLDAAGARTNAYDPTIRNVYAKVNDVSLSPTTIELLYDANGNLVFDGEFAFQYDAWGRLVQANLASLPPPVEGVKPTISDLIVGPFVKHWTYDPFGRLIRTQSPYPDPQSSDGTLRTERFFYDGVRRIQEVTTDPMMTMESALAGEGGNLAQSAANQVAANSQTPLDESAAPAALESTLAGSPIAEGTLVSVREYVWGPGDQGVDELVVQYDAARRASWPLRDAGGDVVALCDLGGTGGAARVITQFTYDAYGQVIQRDDPAIPSTGTPELRVGHKGLFFDRLDVGVLNPSTGADTPRLVPGARLLGYARNRTLMPDLGRWMQPDPNMTGLPVQASLCRHGMPHTVDVQALSLGAHFGDGSNVYQYVGSATFSRHDPTGLFEGFIGGLMTGMDMADMAMDQMDSGYSGVLTGLGLIKSLNEYYAYTDTAADWAGDWSEADDAYARSASWSSGTGYWQEQNEASGAESDELALAMLAAGYHDHHGFPQEFRQKFKALKIDIHDRRFKGRLNARYHIEVVHGSNKGRRGGSYNKFWEQFLDNKHGPKTRANAIAKMKAIKQNKWRIPKQWR